jgi:hypothetical protein
VPLQSPLQPVKVEPPVGVAVSVTLVGELNEAEQVPPQLIPDGELVTPPVPLPAFVTVSVCWTGGVGGTASCVKVAVTERAWVIVTMHVPVPLQPSPLQPVKVEPVLAVAVSVTTVP